jgi:hypothetical protein
LADFGLTPDIASINPKLKDVAENHPAPANSCLNQVQSEMDVETFVAKNPLLRAMYA